MDNNAAEFVGSIPEQYDRGLGPVIFVDCATDIARRVAAGHPARVLETAAGTGIVTRALRDALPAGAQLTATDLNPPMLEVARRKFAAAEAVQFQPADAQALPFADASFDAVVCQFGVMFFPDKDKAYREVRRVLTPGGQFLFNVWDGFDNNPFGQIAYDVISRIFPAEPPQFYKVPFSYPFEPAKDSLVAAGFTDVTGTVLKFDKAIPDLDAFARGMVYGNPVVDQIRARGRVDPDQVVKDLIDAFRAAFGEPAQMPLQALVMSGRKPE